MTSQKRDREGKTAGERFAGIRAYFLESLDSAGLARTELYSRPKLGDKGQATEEEIVRGWAQELSVPLNDILVGIQRAFLAAADRGHVVTSFRYCVPQILGRLNEMKGSRVGGG